MRCVIMLLGMFFLSNHCRAQNYLDEIKKAETAYSKGNYDSCSFHFKNAFHKSNPKGSDLYNAAVCNTLNGNVKEAFSLLHSAIDSGINISKLKIDPDLESLHSLKRWKKLIKQADKAQEGQFNKTQFPDEARKLAALWEQDQFLRFRLGRAYARNDTATANRIWKELKPVDSVNLIALETIMRSIGWPTVTKVGKHGAATAFLIIDHSPREVMEKYFPMLEKAAKEGEAPLANFATMHDRILVNRGKKQIYGTQRYWDPKENKFVYFPIEDEQKVNQKRREVGLAPLKEFNQ